jgi:type III secretion system FlhB-like substrate exporter
MDTLEEFSNEIKEQNQIENNIVLSTEELHDLQNEKRIPPDLYEVIASVHNSGVELLHDD